MIAKETAAPLPSIVEGVEFISSGRYIPLPETLWKLRNRFPTVTRSVLLQCVRCHRWVAQPVVDSPPDEVPTCRIPKDGAAIEIPQQHQPKGERKRRRQSDKEESKNEWRSPRLRQHYENVVDVKPIQQPHQDKSQITPSYFIPNPANFTCQWIYCALDDVWADLREQWLGELYAAIDSVKGEEEEGGASSSSNNNNNCESSKQHRLQQLQKQERINEDLKKELHGRRSERIARKPTGGPESRKENLYLQESSLEPSHDGRITQHVNTLIHHDEAVVASFCWISCDSCGKLRRVHQPFPGGAPFVCSLALNIRSCSVPELEGLNAVFAAEMLETFANEKIQGVSGDMALRDIIEARASVAISSTTVSTTTSRRGSRGSAAGVRHARGAAVSLESSLPFLRELTLALRKRSLGAFAKNIMAIPQEVRAKRESVVRASYSVVEGSSRTNSPPSKKDGWGSDLLETCEVGKKDAAEMGLRPEKKQKKERELQHDGHSGCLAFCDSWRIGGGADTPRGSLEAEPLKVMPEAIEGRNEQSQHPVVLSLKTETNHCEMVAGPKSSSDWTNGTCVKKKDINGAPLIAETSSERTSRRKHMQNQLKQDEENIIDNTGINVTEKNSDQARNNNNGGGSSNSGANALGKRNTGRSANRVLKNQDNNANVKKEDLEVIHWVCCDLCNKWRIVPEKIPEETDCWHCVMRADGTTCDDTDDEVCIERKKRQQRARRMPKNTKGQ